MPNLILNGTRVGRVDLLDSEYLLVGPSGILVGDPGDTRLWPIREGKHADSMGKLKWPRT